MAENLRFAGKILSARVTKTAAWWLVSIAVAMSDDVALNVHPPVGVDVEREPAGNPL
jgi:putative transposase